MKSSCRCLFFKSLDHGKYKCALVCWLLTKNRKHFGLLSVAVTVFQTTIPRTSLFGRAKKAQKSIFEYAAKSKGAAALSAFCEEFLTMGSHGDGKK